MLVLSRKLDESIIIISPNGEKTEIKITKFENDRVKIGIEAPIEFKIFRKEVYTTLK